MLSAQQSARPPRPLDAADRLVVVAASAGGLHAISHVLSGLPRGLHAAIAIVQHLAPRHKSLFAAILNRSSPIHVQEAQKGQTLRPGQAYVAPPDRHLLINANGTMSLTQSKLVHFVRPSADLLLESAADSFGDRVIALVLSGSGTDGATGVQAVKRMGGLVVVQDDKSAAFTGMPSAAIQTGAADYILPLNQIADLLTRLVADGAIRHSGEGSP